MVISTVTSHLMVGPCPRDREDFDQLKTNSITAILSLQSLEDLGERTPAEVESAVRSARMEFRNVPITDFDSLDLKFKLPGCVRALNELIQAGHRVYVHCTAGVTRSPTVIAAYLHWELGWPLEKALDRLCEVRNCSPLGDVIRRARWTK